MGDCAMLQPELSSRDGQALRPPLKWAGGKRWLVPRLAPIWERYGRRRLVEPFCGGLPAAALRQVLKQ